MVYDNIGHGADHCFPPPGYKRPKSMKRTDGVGPVGRRTNGRRTVCGKDVRASCCLCPVQSAPAAAASVRACVRACSRLRRVRSGRACCRCARSCVQLRRPCAVHPVLLQRLFVRAAASAVRACCCSVCSCVQPRRPCARCCLCRVQSARAAASAVRAASAVCSQAVRAAAASVRACSCVGRACVQLRPFVRAGCRCICSCVHLRRPFVRAAASVRACVLLLLACVLPLPCAVSTCRCHACSCVLLLRLFVRAFCCVVRAAGRLRRTCVLLLRLFVRAWRCVGRACVLPPLPCAVSTCCRVGRASCCCVPACVLLRRPWDPALQRRRCVRACRCDGRACRSVGLVQSALACDGEAASAVRSRPPRGSSCCHVPAASPVRAAASAVRSCVLPRRRARSVRACVLLRRPCAVRPRVRAAA